MGADRCRGDRLASVSLSSLTTFDTETLTIWGVVELDTIQAQSFHTRVEDEYSYTIWDFGAGSDGTLRLTLGDTSDGSTQTYSSQTVCFQADTLGTPLEVGVMYSRSSDLVTFFCGGAVEASQSATFDMSFSNGAETHTLGAGLDGKIYTLSIQKSLPFAASTLHTPLKEGLSQCFKCLAHYDMAMDGSTLTDRTGHFHMTVTGASGAWADRWVEVSGY